ncbi:MAG: PAS domain-containing protein, partial [Magnetococcales bacterium]|nr:PAS domain-containing protein [Magnetococcales bacterium]
DGVVQAVLREPEKIGLPVLAETLRLATNSDDRETFRIPPEIVGEEEAWLVGLHPFMVHQQKFRVATFAPESESRVISGHLLSVLLGVMGAIALTAMLASSALVNRVRKPLLRAFAELKTNHARQQLLTARGVLVGEIAARLQQARTPLALGQTLLSALAEPMNLGLGLICLWNDAEQRLVPLARYAGIGATPDDTARPIGALLRQCALERRPFTLDKPGKSYFHIRSGLGDSVPTTILLQPVIHAGRLFAVLELALFRPLTDEDHALLGELQPTVAMSLDILLRAERTAELLAQATAAEEWSRQILSAVEGGILGVDETGRIIFINRSALAMFAMNEDSAIGLAIVDLFHASAEEPYTSGETPIDRTLRDGRPRTRQEVRCRRRDRSQLMVDYSCTAIERDGRIIGAVVAFEETGRAARAVARMGDSESGTVG